jgi:hypothetical protein
MTGLWSYRDTANPQPSTDVVGFEVVATNGSIGKVDQAADDAGASYLVVDTGPWIFGKQRLLPAGVIERLDRDNMPPLQRRIEIVEAKVAELVGSAPAWSAGPDTTTRRTPSTTSSCTTRRATSSASADTHSVAQPHLPASLNHKLRA